VLAGTAGAATTSGSGAGVGASIGADTAGIGAETDTGAGEGAFRATKPATATVATPAVTIVQPISFEDMVHYLAGIYSKACTA
jgi:hypothetical protein